VKTGCSTGLSEYKKFKPENMVSKLVKGSFFLLALMTVSYTIMAQNSVPMGIHYQAVARNSAGNELANTKISVRFSVISDDPLSTPVFQEVHQNVITSRFGVFSLVIGHGLPTGNFKSKSLSEIEWDQANHYLKVEVQFENDYMDMGTMPFLAVPYALYAQKSLEPGPAGPKGDPGEKGEPGDPATDNQSLSFDGSNLSISGAVSTVNLTPLLQTLVVSNDGTGGYNLSLTRGNTINLATIEKDGDPMNEIQDLSYNSTTRELSLLKSTAPPINLTELKNDADADPTNEIQDLQLIDNKLSITGKTGAREINMSTYLDNTDSQALTFTPASNTLEISGGNSVNLGVYRDNTDSQTLTYTEATHELEISGGNKISVGNLVAFRAKKEVSVTAPVATNVTFLPSSVEYNNSGGYNSTSGEFTTPVDGIYTFSINYTADGSGGSRKLLIYLNTGVYEEIATEISSATLTSRSLTMKLVQGDIVKLIINSGMSTQTGTGTFSGFKVY
jgi:hypothetical protein